MRYFDCNWAGSLPERFVDFTLGIFRLLDFFGYVKGFDSKRRLKRMSGDLSLSLSLGIWSVLSNWNAARQELCEITFYYPQACVDLCSWAPRSLFDAFFHLYWLRLRFQNDRRDKIIQFWPQFSILMVKVHKKPPQSSFKHKFKPKFPNSIFPRFQIALKQAEINDTKNKQCKNTWHLHVFRANSRFNCI